MKTIPLRGLSGSLRAKVDDFDADLVSRFSWRARVSSKNTVYAYTFNRNFINGKRGEIAMHRMLIGAWANEKVDHRDLDGLNNCRDNLRFANSSQNASNRRKFPGKTSQYKGVSWNKGDRFWTSSIRVNWRKIHLGCFRTEELAAAAYDRAAISFFGEFARTNFGDMEVAA